MYTFKKAWKKRLICTVLAIAMALTALPATAFAKALANEGDGEIPTNEGTMPSSPPEESSGIIESPQIESDIPLNINTDELSGLASEESGEIPDSSAEQGNFSGYVLDENNAPLANVSVKLTKGGTAGEVVAQTTSAANGVYALNITDPNVYGVLSLVAEHGGKTVTQGIAMPVNTPVISNIIIPAGNRSTFVNLPATLRATAFNLGEMYTPEDIQKSLQPNVVMKLNFTANECEVSPEINSQFTSLLVKRQEIGAFTEIKLSKYTEESAQVSEPWLNPPTNTSLKVAFTLPTGMLNKDKYFVMRYADNNAEIIDSAYDKDSNTLTFETNKTGYFALCYESNVQFGNFKWPATDKDIEEMYCYSDDYFTKSSTVYNPSLSTMSLSFAMASFATGEIIVNGQKDYTLQSKNAKALLSEIGFNEIEVNKGFNTKPETDSIGVIAGNKNIAMPDGTTMPIIAVGIRGANYQREWAGNFTMGETGNHEGFNHAANQVVEFLQGYVAARPQLAGQKIRLWITGFSRAAATACLTAAKLDDNSVLLGATLTPDSIYAYTFETPRGGETAKNGELYNNIFNIVNPNDPVPKVAPGLLGFGYYGKTVFLPAKETTSDYEGLKSRMLERYKVAEGMPEYSVDSFIPYAWYWIAAPPYFYEYKEETHQMSIYMDSFVNDFVTNFAKSRQIYTKDYQNPFRNIMSIVEGISDYDVSIWNFIGTFLSNIKNNFFHYFKVLFSKGPAGLVTTILSDTFKKLKISISQKEMSDLIQNFSYLISKLAIGKTGKVNELVTIGSNLDSVMQVHMPNLTKAWLESMDPNYYYSQQGEVASSENAQNILPSINVSEGLNSGEYRIIRIVGLDSVQVEINGMLYDCMKNGELVAQDAILTDLTPSNELLIYLPTDCLALVNGNAVGSDTFLYAVEEFSNNLGFQKRIAYSTGSLVDGANFSGVIPSYSSEDVFKGTPGGSEYDYSLSNLSGINVDYSQDETYAADKLMSSLHEISVNSSSEQGQVSGSGNYAEGRYANVEAFAMEGYTFLGWYDVNEQLISKDNSYNILVTESTPIKTELIAKFAPNNTNNSGSGTTEATEDASKKSVKTGDTQDIYFWLLLAAIAFVLIFAGVKYFKKERI